MEIVNESVLCNVNQNSQARKDFLSVVKAGVASVDAYMLVRKKISFDGKHLRLANSIFRKKGRVFVVGAVFCLSAALWSFFVPRGGGGAAKAPEDEGAKDEG
ncbi:MAG: hypothetical protein QXS83_03895, partial [Thermoplasmata archaeon]